MKNLIEKFEDDFKIKFPEEGKNCIKLFDELDYNVVFRYENENFIYISRFFQNDGIEFKISVQGYPTHKRLDAILIDHINKSAQNIVFPIALNKFHFIGYEFINNKTNGIYLFDLITTRKVKFISPLINGALFDYDPKYLFDEIRQREQLFKKQKKLNLVNPEPLLRYPTVYVLLEKKSKKERYVFFNEILSEDEYLLYDGEGFHELDDYKILFDEILKELNLEELTTKYAPNKSKSNDIKFPVSKTSELLKNNDSDYFNKEFLQILNEEIKLKNDKCFIYFRDFRFGQEFGIAFIGNNKIKKLKELISIEL